MSSDNPIEIPGEAEITPAWLSAQLHAAGYIVPVRAVQATPIGTGQIGKCLRLQLQYEEAPTEVLEDAPRSLVAKLPSDDPQSQMTGVMLRNYLKEVCFYQQLQPRLQVRTPRCYFAAIEGEGPRFALLLEDLAPAIQGDQLEGTNPTVAAAALSELVGLHAPSWNDHSLDSLEWLGMPDVVGAEAVGSLYQAQLPGFMERYGPRLQADERDIISAFGEVLTEFSQKDTGPQALVHVDFRLDNLLINEALNPPQVTTVDWQSITLGAPLNDVAYFIGAGLRKDQRRPVEEQLVRGYHQCLQTAGVSDYAWQNCWQDYRRGTFAGFSVTVVASMLVQQTARGDEMFTTMARRHARHALDLEAQALL